MTGENRHGNVHSQRMSEKKIKIKHRLWNRYLDTKNVDFLRKFKMIRNEIRKMTTFLTKHIHKNAQIEVANTAKTNPKKFRAYVKNKTTSSFTV